MNSLHKIDKIRLDKKIYIALCFLFFYGIYKNGLIPLLGKYGSILNLIKLIILPIITYVIGFLLDNYFKNNDMYNSRILSLIILSGLPISINFFVYIISILILLLIYNLLRKKIHISLNMVAIIHIVLIIITILFHNYSYLNPLELSNNYNYNFIDYILGRNISGIYISNIFLLILSLIFFLFTYYYKKNIVLFSFLSYFLALLVYSFIKGNMSNLVLNIFNPSIIFSYIFIASISIYSPLIDKKEIAFGLLLGMLTVIFSIFTNFNEGVYIAIILTNILMILIEKGINLLAKSQN